MKIKKAENESVVFIDVTSIKKTESRGIDESGQQGD